MTRISGCIAFNVVAVSIKVSPFFTDEPETAIFRTDPPNFFAATSKDTRVRVEFSKNRFTTVLPARLFGMSLSGIEPSITEAKK